MEIKELLKKPLPLIPPEIINSLIKNKITKTPFDQKNDILSDVELQTEIGYVKMDDDTYLVSMICPMPGITVEMIDWWFWWHPQEKERYQVWFPGEHYGIGYSKNQKEYFNQKLCPPFQNNTQYPLEKIGNVKLPLRIDFITPEEFGFSKQAMEENNIQRIVCGHVGAFNNLVKHTEMAHIFKQTENGLFMISRFWLGRTMKNQLLRKLIITKDMAKGMAEHCCVEYRNLCEILPILYEKYK
ncbi:MAG: hypothetical protein IJZ57_08160 [Clostridia bacterium]|nr:hypothetical protein [Clostridia bacterium]